MAYWSIYIRLARLCFREGSVPRHQTPSSERQCRSKQSGDEQRNSGLGSRGDQLTVQEQSNIGFKIRSHVGFRRYIGTASKVLYKSEIRSVLTAITTFLLIEQLLPFWPAKSFDEETASTSSTRRKRE